MLDCDRAPGESGRQVAVFGRRGSRCFTLEEMKRRTTALRDREIPDLELRDEF